MFAAQKSSFESLARYVQDLVTRVTRKKHERVKGGCDIFIQLAEFLDIDVIKPLALALGYSADFRFFPFLPDFGKRFRRVDGDDRPCDLEIADRFFESTRSKEVDSAGDIEPSGESSETSSQ